MVGLNSQWGFYCCNYALAMPAKLFKHRPTPCIFYLFSLKGYTEAEVMNWFGTWHGELS